MSRFCFSAEKLLPLLIDNLKEHALFLMDAEKQIVEWTSGVGRLLGYEENEFLGRNGDIIFTPHDCAAGQPEIERQQVLRLGSNEDERYFVGKDGSLLWCSSRLIALRDEAGTLQGFARLLCDKTRNKPLSEQLNDADDHTREILESISDVFYALDENLVFTYLNNNAEKAWGKCRAELIGKSLLEAFPQAEGSEPHLKHLQVLRERKAVHYEAISPVLHKWIAVSMFPSRRGGMSVYFHDIHVRKVAEFEQSRRAALDAFRVQLGDALRSLSEVAEIQATASQLIGEYLGASRAMFIAIDSETKSYYIQGQYHAQGQSFPERGFSVDFVQGFVLPLLWQGQPVVINDTANETRFQEPIRQIWLQAEIGSMVAIPLFKSGQRLVVFCIHNSAAHDWTSSEVELVQEVAERTWATAQRASTEAALRASEEKYRTLFDSMDEGYCIIQMIYDEAGKAVDWRFLQVNRAFERNNGLHNAQGKTMCEMAPEIEPKWMEIYDNVAQTGEPLRFEEDSVALGRNFTLYAFRINEPEKREVAVIFTDITERAKAEAILRRSHEELEGLVQERTIELTLALEQVKAEMEQRRSLEAARTELVKRVVTTQEEERGRISRDLHDNLGQHLTGVMLGLEVLDIQITSLLGGRRQQELPQLGELRVQVDNLMQAAHRQAWELRPAELDDMGVEAALGQYIRDWNRRTGLKVDFQALGWESRRLEKELETTIYRVVQEALTNVARHANASQVAVLMELNSNQVSAIIEDNGRGFDPTGDTPRLGLLGMRERLSIVGGSFEIESSPEVGTTVFARLPVSKFI